MKRPAASIPLLTDADRARAEAILDAIARATLERATFVRELLRRGHTYTQVSGLLGAGRTSVARWSSEAELRAPRLAKGGRR